MDDEMNPNMTPEERKVAYDDMKRRLAKLQMEGEPTDQAQKQAWLQAKRDTEASIKAYEEGGPPAGEQADVNEPSP